LFWWFAQFYEKLRHQSQLKNIWQSSMVFVGKIVITKEKVEDDFQL